MEGKNLQASRECDVKSLVVRGPAPPPSLLLLIACRLHPHVGINNEPKQEPAGTSSLHLSCCKLLTGACAGWAHAVHDGT